MSLLARVLTLATLALGGAAAGTLVHESAHAATARALGGRVGLTRVWPAPRVRYALAATAPRWHDHAIRLAPQALGVAALVVAVWVGVDVSFRGVVAAGFAWSSCVLLGGWDDYATVVRDASAWVASWSDEELFAALISGSSAVLVGALAIGWTAVWLGAGMVACGILCGVGLARPDPAG